MPAESLLSGGLEEQGEGGNPEVNKKAILDPRDGNKVFDPVLRKPFGSMTLGHSPVNRQGVDEVDSIAVLKRRQEQQVGGDEGQEKGHPAAQRVSSCNQDGEQEWNDRDSVGVPAPNGQPEENSRDDQPCPCSGIMGEHKG